MDSLNLMMPMRQLPLKTLHNQKKIIDWPFIHKMTKQNAGMPGQRKFKVRNITKKKDI
jgi:hypothetical protein